MTPSVPPHSTRASGRLLASTCSISQRTRPYHDVAIHAGACDSCARTDARHAARKCIRDRLRGRNAFVGRGAVGDADQLATQSGVYHF